MPTKNQRALFRARGRAGHVESTPEAVVLDIQPPPPSSGRLSTSGELKSRLSIRKSMGSFIWGEGSAGAKHTASDGAAVDEALAFERKLRRSINWDALSGGENRRAQHGSGADGGAEKGGSEEDRDGDDGNGSGNGGVRRSMRHSAGAALSRSSRPAGS
jgi:hypothetical protein